MHVPPILADPKFLLKLRAGGARKALARLELLTKLHQLVSAGRRAAFASLDAEAREVHGLAIDGSLKAGAYEVRERRRPGRNRELFQSISEMSSHVNYFLWAILFCVNCVRVASSAELHQPCLRRRRAHLAAAAWGRPPPRERAAVGPRSAPGGAAPAAAVSRAAPPPQRHEWP